MLDVMQLLKRNFLYLKSFLRRGIVHEADYAIVVRLWRLQLKADDIVFLYGGGNFAFITGRYYIVIFFIVVEHVFPAIFADIVIIE